MRWTAVAFPLFGFLFAWPALQAQKALAPSPFQMEQSTSKASLRGIHAVGGGVAWASGTDGTVLRTEDAGFVWQSCAMPPGAEKLDFRGVWAWDAITAIVMSSGQGEASRLYKTTDGCVSWKLLATNTDKDGFWDAIQFSDEKNGYLLGDPVGGEIVLMNTGDGGAHWKRIDSPDLSVGNSKLGFFAASNTSMLAVLPFKLNGTPPGKPGNMPWFFGGAEEMVWFAGSSLRNANVNSAGPLLFRSASHCQGNLHGPDNDEALSCITVHPNFDRREIPLAGGNDASGVFSLGFRTQSGLQNKFKSHAIAVGGDYLKPDNRSHTAAWSGDFGQTWTPSAKPPHGYRSAVAWDEVDKAWITAGPNGSDYSLDDGKTWQTLDVTEVKNGWNAISLPWFVGPNGRIGKLVSLPKASPDRR
jgi:hypothetical protein